MNTNLAYGFTETELDIAKHTDLLGLLPSLGYTLKRIGSYYTTAEMDSIRIRDPTRWKRYSTRQSGDAITFLQEFCGMRFPEAVDYLLAYHGRSRDSPDRNQPVPRPKPPPPREKPPFVLPPANPDQRRVFAYLRKRCVSSQVIRAFIDTGLGSERILINAPCRKTVNGQHPGQRRGGNEKISMREEEGEMPDPLF